MVDGIVFQCQSKLPLFTFPTIVNPKTTKNCQLLEGCVYSILFQMRHAIIHWKHIFSSFPTDYGRPDLEKNCFKYGWSKFWIFSGHWARNTSAKAALAGNLRKSTWQWILDIDKQHRSNEFSQRATHWQHYRGLDIPTKGPCDLQYFF